MLLSAVVNAVQRIQHEIHKTIGHFECDLNVLNKSSFYFSIDSAFLQFSAVLHSVTYSPDGVFWNNF